MTSTITERANRTKIPESASASLADQPIRRSSWQILGRRDFRLFFIGSLISNLGTWLQSTAQVLITYKVTHSVFMVGLIASAQFAGMVVSPWASVLADRFSPRAVLVGTQSFSALIAGVMAWRYHGGLLGVHSLLVGAFGLGFAFALALPVQTALVTALVREEDAADAVKMNSVSYNAGRALAPALCVPVIMFIQPGPIFSLNAFSFVVFVIVLQIIPIPRADRSRTVTPTDETLPARPPARVRDGLIAALHRRRLLLLMAIVAMVTLADDPILVLSPSVAARLHMPSAWAGYFIAALGWGSVLGSLVPTTVTDSTAELASRHASRRAAFSLLVLGISVILFTVGLSFEVSLVAVIAAGGAGLFTGTAAQTALLRHQKKNSADVATVASVAALWAIAWAGTKPFASLLDGWLASRYGVVATSIALTSPAIIIALCELLLPRDRKMRINNYSERIASRMVSRLRSSTSAHPGSESQPSSAGIETEERAAAAAA